jgi:hypothetical protein
MSDKARKNWIVGSVIGTLVLGGAAVAFFVVPRGSDSTAQATPQASPDNPDEYIASAEFKALPIKEQMRYFGENRDKIDREKAGQLFRARMNEMVEEWFALPEGDRVAYLDARIDEWEEMREEMRRQREEDQRRREEEGEDEEADDEKKEGEGEEGRREPNRGEVRASIRERTENTSPEQRAKAMAFFGALQARRAARGMDSGWGGRGG